MRTDPVTHPTNRVWPGDPEHSMPTIEASYEDGYKCGAEWPIDRPGWQHVPGGPYVITPTPGSPFYALQLHSTRVREAWLKGWHEGFRQTNTGNLPAWYRG